jgi:hypothetical protein
MNLIATAENRKTKQPDYPTRPPIYAYENPVVQAELVINGNGW